MLATWQCWDTLTFLSPIMRTLSGCIVGNSIHPQGSLWKPFSLAARSLTFLLQPRHPIQSLESKPRHIPNTSLYLTLVSRKTAEQFGLSFTKSCQICSYIARPNNRLVTRAWVGQVHLFSKHLLSTSCESESCNRQWTNRNVYAPERLFQRRENDQKQQ